MENYHAITSIETNMLSTLQWAVCTVHEAWKSVCKLIWINSNKASPLSSLSSQLAILSIYQFDIGNDLCTIKLAKISCSTDYYFQYCDFSCNSCRYIILQFMSFAYCICHVAGQFIEAMRCNLTLMFRTHGCYWHAWYSNESEMQPKFADIQSFWACKPKDTC